MKKSILNLTGAQSLSKNEQKKINGGITQGMAICCKSKSQLGGSCNSSYPYLKGAWCCSVPDPNTCEPILIDLVD
ncbi:hypothetical protein [Flavobacterium sp. 9AF]|uniref:hypothetical protein n=1 Tax=Flavobacterium sp. 9AF TaxID=2653142 RepID=UPI00135AE308|nr:hypothetical protein [Flavobacterium sp. 9AF]